MSRSLSVATIGDINIDHITDVSGGDTSIVSHLNDVLFSSIHSLVGGNGVFFADAAVEAGFKPSFLLACVGADPLHGDIPDLAAQKALRHLQQSGVEPVVSFDTHRGTGQVFILYHGYDQRLMIADRGANGAFTLENLPKDSVSVIRRVDLLHVSGYCLLHSPQREAVKYLMQEARKHNVFVSVDVVPHSIAEMMSFEEFLRLTHNANALATEGSTIMKFFNLKPTDVDAIEIVVNELRRYYDFFVIRLNDLSDIIVGDRYQQRQFLIPYVSRITSLRFTDRVLANVMYAYLKNKRDITGIIDYIDKIIMITSSDNP